jgi:hypothetical protein
MGSRIVTKSLLVAAACAFAIVLTPAESIAQQKSKGKMVSVPPGGCGITAAALENGQTCAATCNAEKWCPVQWCVQGKLEATIFSCWEPSGVCNPKC